MITNKIKDIREDNDLTQQKVADYLNVKRSTYTMWELGDVNFPIEKLVLLAELFHTNIEYMLGISYSKTAMKYETEIDSKYIGYQLRKVRVKMRKTQKDFADLLGIRQSSYSYYEDGRTRIPTDKLIILAKTYHISINQLCGGIPLNKRHPIF